MGDHAPRKIQLLGGAAILEGATPLAGPAAHRHRLALLALLIATGRPLTRDKLIGYLWPDGDAEHGRNSLKVAVYELRKLLGESAIRTTGDQLHIDTQLVPSDLADFQDALASGRIERAASLYSGPFLDGFFLSGAEEFEQWVEVQRSRNATSAAKALEQLAEEAETRSDLAAAAQWWRQLLDHNPDTAQPALRLMRVLDAMGDRAGALRVASTHETRRRAVLEIDPDPLVAAFAAEMRKPLEDAIATPFVLPARVAPPLTGFSKRVRTTRARPQILRAILGFVALLVTITAVRRFVSTTGRSYSASESLVAIQSFRVASTNPDMHALANGVAHLLSARFTGEGGPRAIEWKDTSAHSLEDAREQAIASGARNLITGDVVIAGDNTTLSATMYNAANGEVIAHATRSLVRRDSLGANIDRLAGELLLRAAKQPDERINDLMERPVAALRSFLAASAAYRVANYAAAESLYARSLDIDSTFGLAGLGLAMSNSWRGTSDAYGRGRDAALHGRARLAARDQGFVDAFFAPDPSVAAPQLAGVYIKHWEDVSERWPDWALALYELGDRYYHYGSLAGEADQQDRARTAFQRALQIDSQFVAPLHHLVEIEAVRRDTAALRVVAQRYFDATPSVSRERSAVGWLVAMSLNDVRMLGRVRRSFDSLSTSDLARIVWSTDADGWPPADANAALDALDKRATITAAREDAFVLRWAHALNQDDARAAHEAALAIGKLFPDRPIDAVMDAYAAMLATGDTALAADAERRMLPITRSKIAGDHVRRAHQYQAMCLVAYAQALRDPASAMSLLATTRTVVAAERNGWASRIGRVCTTFVDATIAVGVKRADARETTASLDSLLLQERVPPHIVLEAGTLISSRLHEQLGDKAGALLAARRRERLTGPPLLLRAERAAEARLTK